MSSPSPKMSSDSRQLSSSSPRLHPATPVSSSPQSTSPLPPLQNASLKRLRDIPQHSSASAIKGHASLAIRLSETCELNLTQVCKKNHQKSWVDDSWEGDRLKKLRNWVHRDDAQCAPVSWHYMYIAEDQAFVDYSAVMVSLSNVFVCTFNLSSLHTQVLHNCFSQVCILTSVVC